MFSKNINPAETEAHSTVKEGTERNKILNNVKITGFSTNVTDQTESDSEWEKISQISALLNKAQVHNKIKVHLPQKAILTKVLNRVPKKKVKFGENTKLVFDPTTQTNQDIQQERGIKMLEDKEKYFTPIRIEFNIEPSGEEFRVLNECSILFEKMRRGDPYIQVLTGDKETVRWEQTMSLPEGPIFKNLFQLREQILFEKEIKRLRFTAQ